MVRSGKSDKAQRQARRQSGQRKRTASSPESSARPTHAPTPPPLPREEVTAVRALEPSPAPAELELDDDFFAHEAAASYPPELDAELEAERENPLLSPAQHRRRAQLRRQVGALVAGLALFALLTSWLRFAG